MSTIRKRALAAPWYPLSPKETLEALSFMGAERERGEAVACVAPHAGWYYSGKTAVMAIAALDPDADTVIVFGGHLSESARPLYASEDYFNTALGLISADKQLSDFAASSLYCQPDKAVDNTVEIQLPLVKWYYPKAKLVWLRMPANMDSWSYGKMLARECQRLGRKAVVIGSTDLTHYGDDYGFSPHGYGKDAEQWVKNTNDKRFIDALLEAKPELALERAIKENSACSPGAALAALGYAETLGASKAALLGYTTSAERIRRNSFVGYAAIAWTSRCDQVDPNSNT